jgi:DNA-binding XRE family transcriptional regulator
MPASKRKHVLARLREHLNLTQQQLALWCGYSEVTIQSIEVNRLRLSEKLAEQISRVTGAPVKWLLANDLKSPIPNLKRNTTPPGNLTPRLSRKVLFMAMTRALHGLEWIEHQEALDLFNYYTTDYLIQLEKAFGKEKRFSIDLDYIEDQIKAFRNDTEEEPKSEETENAKNYITPHADASDAGAFARQEKKKPRQPRKVPHRIRVSP